MNRGQIPRKPGPEGFSYLSLIFALIIGVSLWGIILPLIIWSFF